MQPRVSRRLCKAILAVLLLSICSQRPAVLYGQQLPVIRIGVSSNDGAAVAFYAQDQGLFAQAGLNAEIHPSTNGASVAAAVVAGGLDVAVSNVMSIASAHAKGIPLSFIAPSAMYSSKAPVNALLVEKDSTIGTAADLSGKTVAVDGLNNVTQVGAEGWIDSHGGDSRAVHFVEMPFSEMVAAIARHTVDAAVIAEPALSTAKTTARVLGYPLDSIGDHFILTGWFASNSWIAKNPDIVRRFANAIRKAAEWGNRNHNLSASILAAHSRIPITVIDHMTRAVYGEALDPKLLQPQINAAVRYGVLRTRFPASELIHMSNTR